MSGVPPRRGQRVKSIILPPFMGGNAFQTVAYRATPDAAPRYGILERRGKLESRVWLEYDLKTTMCANECLVAFNMPDAPTKAYKEVSATIGGIGLHLRWNIIFPNKKVRGPLVLDVGDIVDRNRFVKFVESTVRPFGLCRFEFVADDAGTLATTVDIPEAKNVGMVAAALHCAGYSAKIDGSCHAKLAIERYDRSEHMWWNQEQKVAGPLRDVHRWVFDFVPRAWHTLPFTWQSLASNIDLDPYTEAEHLPLPLRDVFLTRHIDRLGNDDADQSVAALKKLRGRPSVTCRLSPAQNRQILLAAYWSVVAPFVPTTVAIAQIVRFRFMLFGYTSREIGGYEQKALHLGHGASIRTFRNKPQYKRENLSNKTLNKICKSDGSMQGSGFKGTRGKYGHKDFPRYEPRVRMKRSGIQEKRMRQLPSNIFVTYHGAPSSCT